MSHDSGHEYRDRIVLIVEPNPQGHRLYYVALLVEGCRSRGQRALVFTTPDAFDSAQWKVHLSDLAPAVVVEPKEPKDISLADIERVATESFAKLTILPDGDKYLVSLLRRGWRGCGSLSVLAMRPDGQSQRAFLKEVKGLAKKGLILSVNSKRNVRVSALRSPLSRPRGPIRWAPDPITLQATDDLTRKYREILAPHAKRYWIGVFGSVTPRKNLPLIIESILNQPDVGLVIGGTIDPQVEETVGPLMDEFASVGGQIVLLSGTLTDPEFDSAISAVDCVVAAHSNEGPSGVVIKAAAAGKRLVLAGATSLRRDALELGDQAAWSDLDAAALSRVIATVKKLPAPNSKLTLNSERFVSALT